MNERVASMKWILACMFLVLVALAAGRATAADDAAAVCASMKKMVDASNAQQSGKMIDAVTRGETAVADCDAKVVALKWTITIPVSQLKGGWQDFLKGNLEGLVCRDMDFMGAMAAGWKITGQWTPTGADAYVTEVSCS